MFELGESVKSYSKNSKTNVIADIQIEIITKIDDKYIYAQSVLNSKHDVVYKYHKSTLEYVGSSELNYYRVFIRKLNILERISLCLK